MEQPAHPNHVWVYGNDHSPWVQAVLLGLHEKGLAHHLVNVPPLAVFVNSGVLMPAASIDDGDWMLDSERILVALGVSDVPADERRALQRVFAMSALRRVDDLWTFWNRFSRARDGHPVAGRRLWNHFWRPFSMLYFSTLIMTVRGKVPRPTSDELVAEFSSWQDRLGPGAEFLGGDGPDNVDFQLFGLVQMCASIPGPSYEVLRQDPKLQRLREWVGAMQNRFSDYAHLYTAPHFEPRLPEIESATGVERLFYWMGAALVWIAFPITVPLALYFSRRVRQKGLV
jgi:glutathione S-transferase